MPGTRATHSRKGKARVSDMASSSEDEELAAERVGPPLKKKRTSKKPTSKKPTSKDGLNFNQFPPEIQKKLMKQALRAMTHAKDADADAGIQVLFLSLWS
jgi:hypothetical protein